MKIGDGAILGQKMRTCCDWVCSTLTFTSIMLRMSKPIPASTTYSISDLAQEFDLTTRAIRFYEDMGLLQPERQGAGGRTRVYSPRDRTRLRLTLRAKRLGLSLVEAKEIIELYDSPRDTGVQLERFLQVLGHHRQQLEERMEDLQVTLDEVRAHEKEAKSLLRKLAKPKAA
jgi:DNA-binding transcriptional MerR regulator